jgi:hypothetical protein
MIFYIFSGPFVTLYRLKLGYLLNKEFHPFAKSLNIRDRAYEKMLDLHDSKEADKVDD